MNTLYIFDIGPEVSRVIDFILKEDAGDFIPDEVWRLDGIVGGIEEVRLERSGGDGELEIASCLHVCVADGAAPHFESIGRHAVFGGGLFVFAVVGFVEAMGPGVAVVPVEGTVDWEKGVVG